jgi:hypothetical protein
VLLGQQVVDFPNYACLTLTLTLTLTWTLTWTLT